MNSSRQNGVSNRTGGPCELPLFENYAIKAHSPPCKCVRIPLKTRRFGTKTENTKIGRLTINSLRQTKRYDRTIFHRAIYPFGGRIRTLADGARYKKEV